MPSLQFRPFNQAGELVKRAFARLTFRKYADREAVADKVAECARRQGVGRIVHVEVVDKQSGELSSAWDVRDGAVVQTDGPGNEKFETAYIPADTGLWPTTPEAVMATEEGATAPKKEKAAKAPKAPKPAVAKGPSKKDQVLALLKGKGGATIDDITKSLGVGPAAARALIGDCQKVPGVTVKREKVDGVSKYSA